MLDDSELEDDEDTQPTPYDDSMASIPVGADDLEPSLPPPSLTRGGAMSSIPVGEDDLEPEEDTASIDPFGSTMVSAPRSAIAVEDQVHAAPVILDKAAVPVSGVDPLAQTIPAAVPAALSGEVVGPGPPRVTSDTPTLPEDGEAPVVDATSPVDALENSAAPATQEEASPPAPPPPSRPLVEGIGLDEVRGFEDLPEEAQLGLVASARLETLAVDEEVGSFAAALVLRGSVGIMPAIADVPGGVAAAGDVVFTQGTLDDGIVLRVVALEDDTRVASWSAAALDAALADCPWVADDLRRVADRFQALGGAALGPLGERLDDSLRRIVTDRLDVRYIAPGEVIVEVGKPVPGLHVVGAGRVEMLEGDQVVEEIAPGEFLFAAEVMSAGRAHATARAGDAGALVLFGARAVAHELMVSVPPLLEVLAG
jgi:CRP-like cAMP-binding protein